MDSSLLGSRNRYFCPAYSSALRLPVLVVDVVRVLVHVEDDQRGGQPQRPLGVLVADHVVQPPVDRVDNQHRPPRGRLRAGDEVRRPPVERPESLLDRRPYGPGRVGRPRGQPVEVQLVEDDAVPPAGLHPLHRLKRDRVDGRAFRETLLQLALDPDERFERAAVVGGVVRGDLGSAQEPEDLGVPQRLWLAGDEPAPRMQRLGSVLGLR